VSVEFCLNPIVGVEEPRTKFFIKAAWRVKYGEKSCEACELTCLVSRASESVEASEFIVYVLKTHRRAIHIYLWPKYVHIGDW